MPTRPPTPCTYPRCAALVQGSSRCAAHRGVEKREYERSHQRKTANARGYNYRWQKARLTYLKRHPLCAECERQGRVMPANEVDHIIPHRGNQVLFWDTQNNWQGLCKPCHSRKTVQEGGRWGGDVERILTVAITIVCGPPASGKTTYVRERAQPGDLILDLDALMLAMTPVQPTPAQRESLLPFALQAKEAILNRLMQASTLERAWVITSAPTAEERIKFANRFKAEVVFLRPTKAECKQRAFDRTDGQEWNQIIDWWFQRFTPDQEKVTA